MTIALSYLVRLVKKLKSRVGVEVTLSEKGGMTKWIENQLVQKYGVETSANLKFRLDFEYSKDPYGLATALNELSSSWWSLNRSGYDAARDRSD